VRAALLTGVALAASVWLRRQLCFQALGPGGARQHWQRPARGWAPTRRWAASDGGAVSVAVEPDLATRLAEAETKLRKAKAFNMGGLDVLQFEVDSLSTRITEARGASAASSVAAAAVALAAATGALAATKAAAAPPGEAAADAPSQDAERKSLGDKLTFDALKAMSNEERLAVATEAGPAFTCALLLVGLFYWSVTLPIFAYIFHESTGAWPNLTDWGFWENGNAAGAVAGLLSITALLKPVKVVVSLLITPWTSENVLPSFRWFITPFQDGDSKQR